MKKNFISIPLRIRSSGCKKELFCDKVAATGRLQKDVSGNCLPVLLKGNYKRIEQLKDYNKVTSQVLITYIGIYIIQSDTIDGIYFESLASFEIPGIQSLQLQKRGTLLNLGTFDFTFRSDSSICTNEVVMAANNFAFADSNFTFAGAPNNCIPTEIYGSYIKDITMRASDSFTVNLAVTVPGTVAGAVATISTDYFPLTKNSCWVYDDSMGPGNTIKRTVTNSFNLNGNLYKIINEAHAFGTPIQNYFRKSAAQYSEYGAVDQYTVSLVCVPTNVYQILLFPKIWSSTAFPFISRAETAEKFYARGIGLIYRNTRDS